jgi:hypothetical protein
MTNHTNNPTFGVYLPSAITRRLKAIDHGTDVRDYTAQLEEWTLLIDPVGAVDNLLALTNTKSEPWEYSGRVKLTPTLVRALKELAKSAGARELWPALSVDGPVENTMMPRLIGLAVLATAKLSVSLEAAKLARELDTP